MKLLNSLAIRLLLICTVVYFSIPLIAGRAKEEPPDFCISNEAEYNKHRTELPKYFQTLPAVVGGEKKVFGFDIYAVVKLSTTNGALVFSYDLWKLGSRYKDKAEIKSVCFYVAAKKMKLSFMAKNEDSGKMENVTQEAQYTDTEYIAEDFPLKHLSEADHKALAGKIVDKQEKKTGQKIPADEVTK